MTVELWQLAVVGLTVTGAGGYLAKRFIDDFTGRFTGVDARINTVSATFDSRIGMLDSRVHTLDSRVQMAEHSDSVHKKDLERLERQLLDNTKITSEQNAKMDKIGNDIRTLMTDFAKWQGRLEERLDIRKELRGLVGRRTEDVAE